MTLLEWLPIAGALLGAGVVAGILAGLLGVGGGLVMVPVLFQVFQGLGVGATTAMLLATSTSLMTIVPTSLSSARSHRARGNVDAALVRRWLVPMVLGVALGTQAAQRTEAPVLTAVFGVIALLAALNLLLRENAPPLLEGVPGWLGSSLTAACIGFLSVMMGVGAGTLGVTAMTAYNVPPHRAVGTAAVFGLAIAIPGAALMLLGTTPGDAPQGTIGYVNLPGFLLMLPATVLCAPLGVRLGARLPGVALKRIFAGFLLLVAVRMLWVPLREVVLL